MQFYIGCSGFYNKDWKNKFYPEGLPQSKWFEYYCTRFNSLELNTTFYRFPKVEFLQRWYNKSPADFSFSVKAPRLITHYKQFNGCESLVSDFYGAIKEGLKEKLGPVLFQLPSKIEYSPEFLERIISAIDHSYINVFEFRNETWWNNEVFTRFSKHKISFCGISIKSLPDDIMCTTNNIYYRFHGIKKLYFSQYPTPAIKQFAEELVQSEKIKSAYVFFNNTATMAAINNAEELKRYLNNSEKKLKGLISRD